MPHASPSPQIFSTPTSKNGSNDVEVLEMNAQLQQTQKYFNEILQHKKACVKSSLDGKDEDVQKIQDKKKVSKSPSKNTKCVACRKSIVCQALCALDRMYHTECFVCHQCKRSLKELMFGVDKDGNILCPEDYIETYSPTCSLCKTRIAPISETWETVRVVALGKEFHVDCYKCQDCGTRLTDEASRRCYPLDDLLLCYFCHRNRKKPHKKVELASAGHLFFNPNSAKGPNDCKFVDENGNFLLSPTFV